jgi:PBP1b-binding outer membrane lipoprotein LpoB
MFKMKKIVFISILLILFFTSCDGRNRATHSNKENVENSKLSDSFLVQTKYIPQVYSEVISDTILSNGFRVKLKFYSDMESSYLNEFQIDSITYKHYYRNFNAEIKVFKNEKEIYSNTISHHILENMLKNTSEYFNTYILTDFWIEQFASNMNDKAIVKLFFCKPESEICKTIRLLFSENNEAIVELIEDE